MKTLNTTIRKTAPEVLWRLRHNTGSIASNLRERSCLDSQDNVTERGKAVATLLVEQYPDGWDKTFTPGIVKNNKLERG